jgi:2-phospho-L-lactate/phosphoenolpyruvate guanylyltransferase
VRSVIAIIPVGTLDGAKSRLGAVLDAEERRDLAETLARRTIAASVAVPGIAETLVITPDDDVRQLALELGARPMRQRTTGLNEGLREARAEAIAAGADAVIVLPIDLPGVTPSAIGELVDLVAVEPAPLMAIVADRHGRGTNALLLDPPELIDFRFGGDSHDAHVAAAMSAGATVVERAGPLRLDIDTPDDLVLADRPDHEPAHG